MKSFVMCCIVTLLFANSARSGVVVFQDNFESNTTVNTVAYPTTNPPVPVGNFDPDSPAIGAWVITESHPEWAQVSSFTGGVQPDFAHSGSNYLIAGHVENIPPGTNRGLARANFTKAVSQARVQFYMWWEPWTGSGRYDVVQGRNGTARAFELSFFNDESVKWNSNGGGSGTTLPGATIVENAWNHILVDYDGIAGSAKITINNVANTLPTILTQTSFDNLFFRAEHHGYYDDILVTEIPEPAAFALLLLGLSSSLCLIRRHPD